MQNKKRLDPRDVVDLKKIIPISKEDMKQILIPDFFNKQIKKIVYIRHQEGLRQELPRSAVVS